MAKHSSEYKRKNVTFDLDNEYERKLYEWLTTLQHGTFTEETKSYWMKRMNESNKK